MQSLALSAIADLYRHQRRWSCKMWLELEVNRNQESIIILKMLQATVSAEKLRKHLTGRGFFFECQPKSHHCWVDLTPRSKAFGHGLLFRQL